MLYTPGKGLYVPLYKCRIHPGKGVYGTIYSKWTISYCSFSRQDANAGLMLAQRCRRWASIKTALVKRLVFHGERDIPAKTDAFSQCCFNVGRLL